MSLAAKVREQLISSFRIELAEHVQTMNDGLLSLEQGTVEGDQRQTTLENIFRAAHSLKGAARAMGVTMVEQLAHALESVLDDLQNNIVQPSTRLFTACYKSVDAILVVQEAYEAGETTPPLQALQALADLEQARSVTQDEEEPADDSDALTPTDVKIKETAPIIESEPLAPVITGPVPSEITESVPAAVVEQVFVIPSEEELEDVPSSTTPVLGAFGVDETIRVSVSKLDALMAQLSELLVTKIRAEQRLSQIISLREFMGLWQKEWLAIRSAYNRLARLDMEGAFGVHRLGPVEVAPGERPKDKGRITDHGSIDNKVGKDVSRLLGYVGASQDRLREMNALMNNLSREYANDTMHMSLVIDELEQEIKRVRMLPLSNITGTFGRMVRDLAQESEREAVLQIFGGDTELDKRVLEQIKDPLMHLLRNAVDHGLETAEQRETMGKPRTGTVSLRAEQLGKDVVIRVADDGHGLNLEAIRRTLARRGGVDVQSLSEEDLKEAIFNAGISTSPIITDISGRGVGLDVVRRNVEALHGRIDVDTAFGEGTTFTLTLPLTLTSSRGLLVRVSNELFAIPHNAIEYIMYVRLRDVVPLEGQDTVLYNNRPLTLVRLGDVLNLPRMDGKSEDSRIPVVILAAAERRMAFAVDALAGEQEVVIKGLGRQLSRVGGIAGATVMGSGEVVLILNVADLIKLGLRSDRRSVLATLVKTSPTVETRARRRILIVDDSITTRTLEKNILEAAGYNVQLATDGQEALGTIAVSGVPDLIVSDVVMPRLDGFGLTQRIREDPHTASVPVILVTSLDSAEDKARGIEVGADAYITKSSFDQNNLLETIEQLI
ncbi:MAG: hybrid sensor histidine kinase/response regulator [Chloroflexi bacterium]|nr:hybrid sensor histidine kinase/response regulator [Chloroflexota bacterium]